MQATRILMYKCLTERERLPIITEKVHNCCFNSYMLINWIVKQRVAYIFQSCGLRYLLCTPADAHTRKHTHTPHTQCVCVCVCVRERERESLSFLSPWHSVSWRKTSSRSASCALMTSGAEGTGATDWLALWPKLYNYRTNSAWLSPLLSISAFVLFNCAVSL